MSVQHGCSQDIPERWYLIKENMLMNLPPQPSPGLFPRAPLQCTYPNDLGIRAEKLLFSQCLLGFGAEIPSLLSRQSWGGVTREAGDISLWSSEPAACPALTEQCQHQVAAPAFRAARSPGLFVVTWLRQHRAGGAPSLPHPHKQSCA